MTHVSFFRRPSSCSARGRGVAPLRHVSPPVVALVVACLLAPAVLAPAGFSATAWAQSGNPPEDGDQQAEEKPSLKVRAWTSYGDPQEALLASGLLVPVTVNIDNPDEAFSGRIVLETRVEQDGDFGDRHLIKVRTSREVEVGASEQRTVVLNTVIPPGADFLSAAVRLEHPRYNLPTEVVGEVPYSAGGPVLVYAEDRKIFAFAKQEDPDAMWKELETLGIEMSPGFRFAGAGDPLGRDQLSTMVNFTYPDPGTFPANPALLLPLSGVLLYQGAISEERFGEEHIEAVIDYVVGGGTVVLVPGTKFDLYQRAPLDGLLPVRDTEPEPSLLLPRSLLPEDVRRADSAPVTVAGLRATALPSATVELANSEGTPLVVRKPYGLGQVIWFAYDPSAGRVRRQSTQKLSELLRKSASIRDVDDYLAELRELDVEKGAFQLRVPPRSEIISFLVLYIILLVPVNYIVFSVLGRRELAWLVVPLLALAFAYFYYVAGYQSRLAKFATHQHGALLLVPGAEEATHTPATVIATTRFYSPDNEQDLTLSLGDPRLGFCMDFRRLPEDTTPPSYVDYTQDGVAMVMHGVSIKGKSARALRVEGNVQIPGTILATARQDELTGEILVTVENRLNVTLHGPTDETRNDIGQAELIERRPRLDVTCGSAREVQGQVLDEDETMSIPSGRSMTFRFDSADFCDDLSDLHLIFVGEIREPVLTLSIDGEPIQSRGERYRVFMRIL